jgi:hypothetical protein
MAELKLPVKQGEEINVGFTIKQDGEAMDLSDYTVRFQVKITPLVTSPAIIDKAITTVSDMNTIGMINYPQQGQFVVHLNQEDTSFPTGEYSLIIALEQPGLVDIISSKCCNKAIYKICEQ